MAQEQNNITATKIEARAYPIAEPKGNTLAYASINLDDKFAVNGIRVVTGEKGLFVAMPQTKDAKGEYRDLCFPVTKELRQQINDTVLSEYANALDAMVTKRESTVEKLRDAARAAKERPDAPAKEKAAKKSGPEL
jgi:stage V sporulation protein G